MKVCLGLCWEAAMIVQGIFTLLLQVFPQISSFYLSHTSFFLSFICFLFIRKRECRTVLKLILFCKNQIVSSEVFVNGGMKLAVEESDMTAQLLMTHLLKFDGIKKYRRGIRSTKKAEFSFSSLAFFFCLHHRLYLHYKNVTNSVEQHESRTYD